MADTTEFADAVSAYVAQMSRDEFASFVAATRPPDETAPRILGAPAPDNGRDYPNEWQA